MRALVFRVWDDLNKKWLLGYERPKLGGFSMMGEVMMFGEYTNMLNSFSIQDWNYIKITQYTGRTDKNGKDIYEGDTVQSVDGRVSTIIYRDHGFWVEAEDFGWEGEDLWNWDKLEVIGNIFENSDKL